MGLAEKLRVVLCNFLTQTKMPTVLNGNLIL